MPRSRRGVEARLVEAVLDQRVAHSANAVTGFERLHVQQDVLRPGPAGSSQQIIEPDPPRHLGRDAHARARKSGVAERRGRIVGEVPRRQRRCHPRTPQSFRHGYAATDDIRVTVEHRASHGEHPRPRHNDVIVGEENHLRTRDGAAVLAGTADAGLGLHRSADAGILGRGAATTLAVASVDPLSTMTSSLEIPEA